MNDKLEKFHFEIYTKNPETGEGGWDIKFIVAFGYHKSSAVSVITNDVPNFDEIITSTPQWDGTDVTDADIQEAIKQGNVFWYEVNARESEV